MYQSPHNNIGNTNRRLAPSSSSLLSNPQPLASFVDCFLSFCTFSFSHCVVCCSSIYGFWLPLWYLQTLLNLSKSLSLRYFSSLLYFLSTYIWHDFKYDLIVECLKFFWEITNLDWLKLCMDDRRIEDIKIDQRHITELVPLVEQELLSLPDHMS